MSYNAPHYRHVKRNLYEKGLCYFHESRLWTGPWRMQSIYPERNVFRVVKKWRTPGRGNNMSQVKNWDWRWMCFVGSTASWKEVKNKTEEVRLLTDSLECLVRRLTFILLEQVSSLEPLYENHPPLIACQRPCPRPTKSQLLTVGPGATFETKAQLILCCKGWEVV